ncbi:hypothetical protein S7711_02437 [Stachybotrys chartarum IBT 7711]|uniref:DH domain-containing protein n=1 Tax=Stachybotrys chartarum (strain CBS 109288 / IBT 7711) TaxID=1280523 RepID=A0A084AQD8_STACB|nr:hypothetical protein S7711_02437 [Stachybotrys chartarum IBT 7711]
MALVESPSYAQQFKTPSPSTIECKLLELRDIGTDHEAIERAVNASYDALSSNLDEIDRAKMDGLGKVGQMDTLKLGTSGQQVGDHVLMEFPSIALNDFHESSLDNDHILDIESKKPFQRWMRSLHRRTKRRPPLDELHRDNSCELLRPDDRHSPSMMAPSGHHRNSSSGSSFRFVSAVRSASVSLASMSAVTRSRRNTARSHCLSQTNRSSRASLSMPRASEDSAVLDELTGLLDAAATERALQRRRILNELISTEESYVGDVRFLLNVYITILASLPTLPTGLRSTINRNLAEVVELHEEILQELRRIMPDAEHVEARLAVMSNGRVLDCNSYAHNHRHRTSLDVVPEGGRASTWGQQTQETPSSPQEVAEVAKVFARKVNMPEYCALGLHGPANAHQMNRFFIYKEYGAKYELMMKDISLAHRTMPEWDTYQKGLEALASTYCSVRSNKASSKRALTIGDLLVKPIQRICKYPLLFAELLRHTPVSDCPNSHMEIDSTLTRLREATAEMNRATDDVHTKATLEKTWLLQDRLAFPNRKLDATSKNHIRSFGHIRLCGALHVCWQSSNAIEGRYMICLLYRNVLCLASAGRVEPVYTILACISLHRARMEATDNGRGLQSHAAPFSWKLEFEHDHQLYEMIMTACTAKEETEWCAHLGQSTEEELEFDNSCIFGTMDLDIKSMGAVFGKPGTIARRLSIQRAATVGPKSTLAQVILKNTSITRDAASGASALTTINRSQSLLTTNQRVPVLAPPRSERARLEALLTDVWSRETLPFPGMPTRSRSEHLVRTSASSMMRKLSVASITNSFAKRSGSVSRKASKSTNDEMIPEGSLQVGLQGLVNDGLEADSDSDTYSKTEKGRPRMDGGNCQQTEMPQPGLDSVEEAPGTIRRTTAGEGFEAQFINEPILRTSSPNSIHVWLGKTISEKSHTLSTEKENSFRVANEKPHSSGRWARAGVSKSETRSHSFRSLFR